MSKPSIPAEYTSKVVASVNANIDKVNNNQLGRQTAWEDIFDVLVAAGLAWQAIVPPSWVGVHPRNRSGAGFGGSESQVHGGECLRAGFSFKKAADATAFQTPPTPWDHEAVEFNDKQCTMSGGLVPKLDKLDLISVGTTHTNTFLRQVRARVKSVVPELADETGCLNLDVLGRNRPKFVQAVNEGLKWNIIHWAAPFVWPSLPDLIQKALNTDARGQQGEVEIMLSMHEDMDRMLATAGTVDWSKIESNAKASLPPCSSYMGAVATYVRLNSGGSSGELLRDLMHFQKSFACATNGPLRVLGGEFITRVATLSFGPSEKYPLFKNGLLKANLQTNIVVDGLCKLISPTLVSKLTSKKCKPLVEECEVLMSQVRELCSKLAIEDYARTRCVGKLDIRCVGFVLGKGVEIENRIFKDIPHIAQAFMDDIKELTGITTVLDQGNARSADDTDNDATDGHDTEIIEHNMPESVAQMKDLAFQSKKLGFVKGVFVICKQNESDIYEIVSVGTSSMFLTECTHRDSPCKLDVNFKNIIENWQIYKKKVPVQVDLRKAMPVEFKEWQWEVLKSGCFIAMSSVATANSACNDDVQVWLFPTCVRAARDIPKGKLVLAPVSMTIARTSVQKGSFQMVAAGDNSAYMLPFSSFKEDKPFTSPYWHVQSSEEKKQINMDVKWVQVPSTGSTPDINIAVLENTKDICKGALLVRPVTKSKVLVRDAVEPKAKKAKTA